MAEKAAKKKGYKPDFKRDMRIIKKIEEIEDWKAKTAHWNLVKKEMERFKKENSSMEFKCGEEGRQHFIKGIVRASRFAQEIDPDLIYAIQKKGHVAARLVQYAMEKETGKKVAVVPSYEVMKSESYMTQDLLMDMILREPGKWVKGIRGKAKENVIKRIKNAKRVLVVDEINIHPKGQLQMHKSHVREVNPKAEVYGIATNNTKIGEMMEPGDDVGPRGGGAFGPLLTPAVEDEDPKSRARRLGWYMFLREEVDKELEKQNSEEYKNRIKRHEQLMDLANNVLFKLKIGDGKLRGTTPEGTEKVFTTEEVQKLFEDMNRRYNPSREYDKIFRDPPEKEALDKFENTFANIIGKEKWEKMKAEKTGKKSPVLMRDEFKKHSMKATKGKNQLLLEEFTGPITLDLGGAAGPVILSRKQKKSETHIIIDSLEIRHSHEQLEEALGKKGVFFFDHELKTKKPIPLRKETVEHIDCRHFYNNGKFVDPKLIAKEAKRILKKGGTITLSGKNEDQKKVEKAFIDAGFEAEKVPRNSGESAFEKSVIEQGKEIAAQAKKELDRLKKNKDNYYPVAYNSYKKINTELYKRFENGGVFKVHFRKPKSREFA